MGAFPATVTNRASAISIASWDQLRQELDKYSVQSYSWAFRGLQSDQWLLRTSLERLDVAPLYEAERYLVGAFQRRAHHYVSDPPPREDELEWLALMQHHGAPTRLLDWTKSPYVALFFAVRDATDSAGNCAVWGIDLDWCKNQALARINRRAFANPVFDPPVQPEESLGQPELFGRVFLNEPVASTNLKLVASLQPFRMNERLVIQQGLFLCPGQISAATPTGNVTVGFEENLLAFADDPSFSSHVHKFIIPNWLRIDALGALNKMNINQATLFPGIDGFAQSLGTNVEVATRTGKLSTEIRKLNIYTEYGWL
jgi:FRG domain